MRLVFPQRNLVTVNDYLASEWDSHIKREFVGGLIYARPPERNLHNRIACNFLDVFGMRLRGNRFWLFNSDTKYSHPLADTNAFLLSRRIGGLPTQLG